MRRLIWIGLFVAIVPWIVIGIVREATDNDTLEHYYVRAIFDNAANLVQGEDVKVAGVPVGVVKSLEVTDDKKAAVTLRIDDEDFIPWKSDASCVIRPQGLIGEKFVECKPGTTSGKPLAQIQSGDGEGERLLPVANTSSPVDIDLLNDILRLPVPGALRDTAERVRHGPGRPRRRPQRGHPQGQPGAARDRQAARGPRQAEPHARQPRARLRHRARPAGAGA